MSPIESYQTLPYKTIKITHVPSTSPTPTPVLLVTLNRPSAFNAATHEMISELVSAYELFGADERVNAIVLTGAGAAFCVGADLAIGFKDVVEEFKRDGGKKKKMEEYRDAGGILTKKIHTSPLPTIVAINGPAAGFGITMTLGATVRIASRSAKVSFPFTRIGLAPEACSSFFLPRIVGLGRALHLLSTGGTYTAGHELLTGLFSEVVETGEDAVNRALSLAGEMARKTSRVSGAVVRDLVDIGLGVGGEEDDGEGDGELELLEKVHRAESRAFAGLLLSEDSVEGMRAFREKREPVFTGKLGDEKGGLSAVGWRGRGSKI